MNKTNLWSQRLGFSNAQADKIQQLGIENFLINSFNATYSKEIPSCLKDDPKTLAELRDYRNKIRNTSSEEAKKIVKQQIKNSNELKRWWLTLIENSSMPLREKMVLFWHNHFVATSQKVKVNWWIYQHNQILREHAFGNFKELTKKILKTNAMVRYLDNVDNKKDEINENLSRELLELFTIGIGNYSEDDIKNGALALAGLGLGENEAQYRKFFEYNGPITYFGKKGNWKADDLVDLIFEQKNTPYLLTRKILKWFIYDNPSEEKVIYYGDYFRKENYEIKPLLLKICKEEFDIKNEGNKIKNPLEYIVTIQQELNIKIDPIVTAFFLKQQGMDLFNQPNVKGWEGGKNWLTSQIYLQRNNVSDLVCNGKSINRKLFNKENLEAEEKEVFLENINPKIKFKKTNNKEIIKELCDRLLFQTDEDLQKDMESILKYDFDPTTENAHQAVVRLFNFITKTPEFQIL